jgi:predicted TIM-barrel fold metal-dependent hydrolase
MSWYGETPWPSLKPEGKIAVGGTMMFISNAKVVLNLITSGLLERFPKLNFVLESGIGWIPFVLETLDYSLAESGARRLDRLSMSPSEYFRRQIYATFWFEGRDAASSIRRVGIDNVMFETDFPHPICLYPRPLSQVRDCLGDLTPEERRKVLSANAARVYNLPLD